MKNWKEELRDSKESLVELVVGNPVQYAGEILEAIGDKWENEILIVGNYSFYEKFKGNIPEPSGINTRRCEITMSGYRYAFKQKGRDCWFKLNFHKHCDGSIRGKRYDVIIILDEKILNDKEKIGLYRAVAPRGQVILINKTKHKTIKVEDENSNNKSLLQKEISRLYKELSEMEHSEKTTMTRERLINMIEKLEGLNKNHYSYINDYGNSISCGVGNESSESQCSIEAGGISCEVKSKNCINLNGLVEVLKEDEDGIEISISKYWYDSLFLKNNYLKRGQLVSLNQEKYIVEEIINPIGKTMDFKLIKVIK